MLFLWVFGNAVNDRFGNVGYLAFYLAGGELAGVGYLLLAGNAPVLGASGAISAVTGAYLVLFPRARVTLLLWFYVVTTFEMSSIYFLLFQFVTNLWMSLDINMTTGAVAGGVAYVAHSAGYVFGIVIALLLLATRVLPRDVFDLLNLFRSAHRRSQFRRMVVEGYVPFRTADPGQELRDRHQRRFVESRTVGSRPDDTAAAQELELRKAISESLAKHDLASAARQYLQLVQIAQDAVLSRQNQLDVANQLMDQQLYPVAADAYERFIRSYGDYEHIADIDLMLGLIYSRYLHQYDRAEQLLTLAMERLRDARKVAMARQALEEIRRR
jgi:tetratricopeptide (TPR) repeat protein